MSTWKNRVRSGTRTTPPPRPVKAPRKPAINEPIPTRKLNSRTFIELYVMLPGWMAAGKSYDCAGVRTGSCFHMLMRVVAGTHHRAGFHVAEAEAQGFVFHVN